MKYNISLDRGASPPQWRVEVTAPMGFHVVEYFDGPGHESFQQTVGFLVSQDMSQKQAIKLLDIILCNDLESVQTI